MWMFRCHWFRRLKMPTDLTNHSEKSESFIHMKKLPWLASRKEIRDYFSGLSVKKGGILVRPNDAFVAFEDPSDIAVAMSRSGSLLMGTKVQLSVINNDELQEELKHIVCRKLEFDKTTSVPELPLVTAQAIPIRKIRPTPVSRGLIRRSASFSTFYPEESTLPSPVCSVSSSQISQNKKRYFYGKRKVQPTSVSDEIDRDIFAVFHPEICFDVKKMKLDMHCTLLQPMPS